MSVKTIEHKCSKCGHLDSIDITVSSKELNSYGYVVGSKGDFITSLIEKKQTITRKELIITLYDQFPNANNDARLNRVLYEMKKGRLIVESQGTVKLLKKSTVK